MRKGLLLTTSIAAAILLSINSGRTQDSPVFRGSLAAEIEELLSITEEVGMRNEVSISGCELRLTRTRIAGRCEPPTVAIIIDEIDLTVVNELETTVQNDVGLLMARNRPLWRRTSEDVGERSAEYCGGGRVPPYGIPSAVLATEPENLLSVTDLLNEYIEIFCQAER